MEAQKAKKESNVKAFTSCLLVFALCSVARIIEYFFIRTDETILAENFLHKVFGIAVMAAILKASRLSWGDIGFRKSGIGKNLFKGFALGTLCFTVAYAIECVLLFCMNGNVQLSVYTSGFSLNGEAVRQQGILFILLCIGFNLINVWMEEGIFRGLFDRLLANKMSYASMILFIGFLFGIWHWVMPMRDYLEGNSTLGNLLVLGIGYIILSGIMSVKWSMLYHLTGSLWMGLGDHLFNNVVVTNLLHVISDNDADSMQIVRIMIGQLLSFGIVMICYRKHKVKQN